jgi:hypothetical protein
MQGTIIKLNVDGTREMTIVNGPPPLDKLKWAIDGGPLELVPLFNTYSHDDRIVKCTVFCDEEGKNKKLPINHDATILWDAALLRAGHPGLILGDNMADVLVGPIAVVFGDEEFMSNL